MENSIKSLALKYGVYLGLLMILIMVLMYVVDLELMTKWWLNIILFLMILSFGILSSAKSKKILGGFMTFKQAFSSYFITVAIGVLLSTAFSIILFNIIDPEAAQFLKEKIIETSTQMMENFGAPQSEIDKAAAAMSEQEQFSVINQLKSIAWQLFAYAVIGLIVALVMRKSEPISMN
ncbi:DUF4199 domain-containing protein [Gelidibacter pelagius]|uniref:DUF4199 domain-containing protein n=1 Tax=Gelidibacter pelagius TaxID=2819985 RepID=A0ABS3ST56_9FLAO|nr:DUF4199 domain-containing protein [Gelidibacter pelagius]MBO3098854.1 DUF4199 domain-containing protein [Gelidibacter pelagius]